MMALSGKGLCELLDRTLLLMPGSIVWIPGGIAHRVKADAASKIYYAFIEPTAIHLPEQACILGVTPLVRELIIDMSYQQAAYAADSPAYRKAMVLLEELASLPISNINIPSTQDARILKLTQMLYAHPGDRKTMAEWAKCLALSERSLARLMQQETGMAFGRWRQQIQVNIAIQQLKSGASVQDVAWDLGYESATSFNTMFKKCLGKAPLQYMREQASLMN